MKLSRMFAAAGLVVASLGAAAGVQAQQPQPHPNQPPMRVVTTRTTVHTRVTTTHRNGWHAPRCTTVWRHHHRVKRCG